MPISVRSGVAAEGPSCHDRYTACQSPLPSGVRCVGASVAVIAGRVGQAKPSDQNEAAFAETDSATPVSPFQASIVFTPLAGTETRATVPVMPSGAASVTVTVQPATKEAQASDHHQPWLPSRRPVT